MFPVCLFRCCTWLQRRSVQPRSSAANLVWRAGTSPGPWHCWAPTHGGLSWQTAFNSCLWVQRWSGRLSVDDFGKIRHARGTCLATRTWHTCSLAPGSWCCLEHTPRSIVMRVSAAARQPLRGASSEARLRHLCSRRRTSARTAMLTASLARQQHGYASMYRRMQCHGHDDAAAADKGAGAPGPGAEESMGAQSAEQQARPKRLRGAPIIYREFLHNTKQVIGRTWTRWLPLCSAIMC